MPDGYAVGNVESQQMRGFFADCQLDAEPMPDALSESARADRKESRKQLEARELELRVVSVDRRSSGSALTFRPPGCRPKSTDFTAFAMESALLFLQPPLPGARQARSSSARRSCRTTRTRISALRRETKNGENTLIFLPIFPIPAWHFSCERLRYPSYGYNCLPISHAPAPARLD
jgi:hypothetical protein